MEAGLDQEQVTANYESWNRAHTQQLGIGEEVIHQYQTSNPWYMSVLGMMRYWRSKEISN
jgi:hypothetical protein